MGVVITLTAKEEVPGKFGFGVINDNEERLCDFCGTYEWISSGTVFPHK